MRSTPALEIPDGSHAPAFAVMGGFLVLATVYAIVISVLTALAINPWVWHAISSGGMVAGGFLGGFVCVRLAPRSLGAATALLAIVAVLGAFSILAAALAGSDGLVWWMNLFGATVQTGCGITGVVVGVRFVRTRMEHEPIDVEQF